MQLAVLTPLSDGSFRPQKIEVDNKLSITDMLKQPKNFLVCTKSCNGTYHPVASDLPLILEEHESRGNGLAKAMLTNLGFDEDMHGPRFVIFKDGEEAFLLGDIIAAAKKLSK